MQSSGLFVDESVVEKLGFLVWCEKEIINVENGDMHRLMRM